LKTEAVVGVQPFVIYLAHDQMAEKKTYLSLMGIFVTTFFY